MHAQTAVRAPGVISGPISPPDEAAVAYRFGSFRLIPSQQALLDGEARVPVGSRVLDLLTMLVEGHGKLITKQELLARAWPRVVVEESNLKVHIAALRKALGDEPVHSRFVTTVVGQGYRFVAPVTRETLADAADGSRAPHAVTHNLPAALVRPIGRAAVIADLLERLQRVRVLTVAGTGGIGKTTVALAVAHATAQAAEHDVCFVDLTGLVDPRLVPRAVVQALGLTPHGDAPLAALAAHFRSRSRPQLVVLDGCEHVIEAAAILAERISASAAQTRVLATSREPLQAMGEHVYRLEPLECPADPARLLPDEALRYPAVELFLERAFAARGDFTVSAEEASTIGRICKRLDGIPLAIELAATLLNAFGAAEVLNLLDDRFFTLAQGRRTAPERHKSFLATLEWSHQLLPDIERLALRRISVFPGEFTLSSASAVISDEGVTSAGIVGAVASLVTKSMLSAEVRGDSVQYRLLDTTRDYAKRKLEEAGESGMIARRYAKHVQDSCVLHADK
ncbi:winged helix-turn-helix domain-containing protein [Caballeronia sp. LZ035]|uniref:ATP-binding protein n=1 Tax=Caballeronia sp. LZ035 TaxID=3038568 RepID=UPI002861713D|nr:winged helix-turn-helix domain-containing protein [Caballeronia sp. LZ035]MDR5758781.1 winged helix-turn-helix domain-containing protein [Caballeronia sp. LZ035]